MSDKPTIKSLYAPKSTWDKLSDIGGGNMSKGFRAAVDLAHDAWEREQRKRWAQKQENKKGGDNR